MKSVGEAIKAARLAKAWTQMELAQSTALRQPVISRIESGRRQPSISQVRAIARALGVSAAELIEETEAQAA